MFRWYQGAEVCIAYLSDVESEDPWGNEFSKSEWFTRGWTLQELLAPSQVLFFNAKWKLLGRRTDGRSELFGICIDGPHLASCISRITGIETNYLCLPNPRLTSATIAKRMSWASQRTTTREEDVAYSLLGIFDVNMALIYGEGRKAFARLQEEIIRRSTDESIFAWRESDLRDLDSGHFRSRGFSLIASSPRQFANSGDVERDSKWTLEERSYAMTNKGIELQSRIDPIPPENLRKTLFTPKFSPEVYVLELDCLLPEAADSGRPWCLHPVCITLRLHLDRRNHFERIFPDDLGERHRELPRGPAEQRHFYVHS